jgi:excinuclease ABC subunit C
MDIKERIKQLPLCPGIYLMKDKQGKILYIGKASRVRSRVSSYFRNQDRLEPKIRIMVGKIADIDYRSCASETEALILESELIKKLRPPYNSIGKDDKSFPWVKITRDDFPVVSIARPKAKEDAFLIGPFTSAYLLQVALKTLRRIFPFRSCSKLPKRPCLLYCLQLCPGCCINTISRKQYQANLDNLRRVLEGKQKSIMKSLSLKMHALARAQRFEEAAFVRDQIMALETLWIQKPSLGASSVLWQLKSALGLKRLPLRIEGFDISNISGDQNVGSLVSFYKAQSDPSQYRRFRVKSVLGANDYESIHEIVRRRFMRIKEEQLDEPDLIVVDGGRVQVSAVNRALTEEGLNIAVIGIAKKHEHIFIPDQPAPIILPKASKALHLVQHIRNEAHRFALRYHHLLRKKSILTGNKLNNKPQKR